MQSLNMRQSQVAGVGLIAFSVATGISLFGILSVDTDMPFGQLLAGIATDTGYSVGMAAMIAAGAASAAAGGLLYSALRAQDQTLAMLGALGFALMGMVMFAVGTAGLVLRDSAIAMVSATSPEAAAAAAGAAVPIAQLIDKGWDTGVTTFLPMGFAAFGLLLVRARVAHPVFGWSAMAIAAALPFAWVSDIVGLGAAFGALAWLVVFGAWMAAQRTPSSARTGTAAQEPVPALN